MNNSESIKTYLNLADVIILVLGSDQKIHLINQKGCEIIGYTESQVLGKNWFDFFVPERLRESVRQVFFKIISGEIEQVEFFENPVLTSSGEEIFYTRSMESKALSAYVKLSFILFLSSHVDCMRVRDE